MNKHEKLDEYLNESLKDLPELMAPESLLGNIMLKLEEAAVPELWIYRYRWVVAFISSGFVLAFNLFWTEIYSLAYGLIQPTGLEEELATVNTSIQILGTLKDSFISVLGTLPKTALLIATLTIIVVCVSSCAGLGTLFYRLINPANSYGLTHR